MGIDINRIVKHGWRMLARFIERFHLIRLNQGIIEFMVFLIIAIAFWFSQTFKDQRMVAISYELKMINLPNSVILTSEPPSTIDVTVNGRGFAILQYLLDGNDKRVEIDYTELQKMNGTMFIDNFALKKSIARSLPNGVSYVSATPATFEIYYSTGNHRQVPVTLDGRLHTAKEYQVCGVELTPQYVDVYAPQPILDTLTCVTTEPLLFNNLEDTVQLRATLHPIRGVKMVPDSLDVKICVDLFTTKTLSVPIYCENIPDDQILRTFPLNASVSFLVSATMFDNIRANDFLVVVDYTNIKPEDRKCRLQVRQSPPEVSNIKLSPELVDYVIEHE